ncbi:MAG: hypothetical protein Q9170_003968 [Blastenia crenularia]
MPSVMKRFVRGLLSLCDSEKKGKEQPNEGPTMSTPFGSVRYDPKPSKRPRLTSSVYSRPITGGWRPASSVYSRKTTGSPYSSNGRSVGIPQGLRSGTSSGWTTVKVSSAEWEVINAAADAEAEASARQAQEWAEEFFYSKFPPGYFGEDVRRRA